MINRVIIFLLITFCFQSLAFADKPTAIFLKTEHGIRFFSMGGVVNSGNYTDAFFNPWELGWLVNKGVNLSRWSGMIENSSYNFFSSMLPEGKNNAFGVGYLGYDTGMELVKECLLEAM
ncbi:MAG: hypothetical protein ABH886_05640 [Candidatus Desantisbacteria bacterium]